MLELRLAQGSLLKIAMGAVRELVSDANFHCSATGFELQAMDSYHVALVALLLRAEGFQRYRCDRPISMAINLRSMMKMLRRAGDGDSVTLRADDGSDCISFIFESPTQDETSEFQMKLLDIDSEHFVIPDVEYKAMVRMPSAKFQRICKDLGRIGDTASTSTWQLLQLCMWWFSDGGLTFFLSFAVVISVSKEGAKFSTAGDIGAANIVCRQNRIVDKPEESTIIEMQQPVSQIFALIYLNSFTKATPLSETVTIYISSKLPLLVEYKIAEIGCIRYYLAPRTEDDNVDEEIKP